MDGTVGLRHAQPSVSTAPSRPSRPSRPSLPSGRASSPAGPPSLRTIVTAPWAPLVVSALVGVLFLIFQPNVNDLQAALSRQSAAAHGVGLTYWFSWFGGGATPGQYSLLTPVVTSVLTAPITGVVTAFVTTVVSYRATRGLAYGPAAVWVTVLVAWLDIWSGRIPFALGCLATALVLVALRQPRPVALVVSSVLAVAFSPVSGAFVALGLGAVFLVDPDRRRAALWGCLASGATIVLVGLVFGSPGPQGYSLIQAGITAATMLCFLFARPPAALQVVSVFGAAGSLLLVTFANGMGSNYPRLAWIVLPPVIVATAGAKRSIAVLAVAPALIMAGYETFQDLHMTRQTAAEVSYYTSLGHELDRLPNMKDYRLEVVQDSSVHTGAFALLSHAALARGWETQEDNAYNKVLLSTSTLNAISYKVWLDDNAVGYVAYGTKTVHNPPEHALVGRGDLPYLQRIWSDSDWVLYRVRQATPIVAAPEHVVSSTQSQLVVRVPCACRFPVRLRYSRFLQAQTRDGASRAVITDDGTGWTDVRAPRPGTYVFQGSLVGPFH